MTKITDQFKVGDKVKWVKIKRVYAMGEYWRTGTNHQGEIIEILGTKAGVKLSDSQEIEMVPLSKLRVIE